MIHRFALLICVTLMSTSALAQSPGGSLVFDFAPHATYKFSGVVGERVAANTQGWLLRAPAANPGMLAMFRLRDRQPTPSLVPWAGEFVGKYLISAVQACRMNTDPKLKRQVKSIIDELIACQAKDGYLGPFPKKERLLKHWDLWGHYHIMLALLMWHEQTDEPAALAAACKAADLACRIYLDGDRRPRDAGSTEMNLAIIHALGRLYRQTDNERYLQLMRRIEKDWELEGDYLRTGLAGIEFYQTPKPRWESLPDLQGLVELYRITGESQYRTAFLNHWHSIRRLDRRNTGGFSSGEQATGTPYEPTAIETCCTIAWMAMTIDALRISGDSIAADELERSTFNGMLGAQHPSGCWWTYNTPMDGVREASHDTIVFQSRAGTPDLNCCSVNAPRGLGMLSEWALMRGDDSLIVNYYGPMEAHTTLSNGFPVTVRQQTTYPLDGKITLQLQIKEPREFALELRIPKWSRRNVVRCFSQGKLLRTATSATSTTAATDNSGADSEAVRPGSYYTIRRRWSPGDKVELEFDMALRYESGGGQMAGKISVFRGPLLLAYDLLLNGGATAPSPLTPKDLTTARFSRPSRTGTGAVFGRFAPWIIVDIPKPQGETVRLCDFASAGSRGNAYLSWLPAEQIAPPPPLPMSPAPNASVPAGRMLFTVRSITSGAEDVHLKVVLATTADFQQPELEFVADATDRIVVPAEQTRNLRPNVAYYWKLVARNPWGKAASPEPPRRLTIDPSLPPLTDEVLTRYGENADGLMIAARLEGDPSPEYGRLAEARGWAKAIGVDDQEDGSVELDGASGMLVYKLRAFPSRDYSVSLWCMPLRVDGPLGQIFSAWSQGMDDPLRISVQNGHLNARVEAAGAFATKPVPIQKGQWYHVCAVKKGTTLALHLNGSQVGTITVPAEVRSMAHDFALGGNPHFTGSSGERLACRVARLKLWARALSAAEIKDLASESTNQQR